MDDGAAPTRPDPVEIAQALIRCPSVTPAEGGALDYLEELLSGAGFVCTRLPFSTEGTPDVDNLYARFGRNSPNFCFAGHTDVVPPGADALWSSPPFGAEIRDGELYGRGAVDMKGAVACFAAAAIDHAARHGPDRGSISLLITGDEEGPSVNGTVRMLDWLAENGETLDHCVVGEPTNPNALGDTIKIGRRGTLSAAITVYGTQGHVAYPHLADNPVPRLLRILNSLTAAPLDRGTNAFEPSNLEITSIDIGNSATNVIPAEARAALNIRFNTNHTVDSLKDWIEGICREATSERPDGYALDFPSAGDCFLTESGPLTDVVSQAVQDVTGRAPELNTNGGTSDARFIKDHCPVVEFGLVGQTMHKADERVAVADLRSLTEIYARMLDLYFAQSA